MQHKPFLYMTNQIRIFLNRFKFKRRSLLNKYQKACIAFKSRFNFNVFTIEIFNTIEFERISYSFKILKISFVLREFIQELYLFVTVWGKNFINKKAYVYHLYVEKLTNTAVFLCCLCDIVWKLTFQFAFVKTYGIF